MTQPPNNNDERLFRRYLVGELGPEEQRKLEQELMTNQDAFNCLLRAEEELIDEYVREQISGGNKDALESRILQDPKCRRDVQFAALLQRYLAKRHDG